MKPGKLTAVALGAGLLFGGLWLAWTRGGAVPMRQAPPTDEAACREGDVAACDRLGLCKRSGSCRQRRDGRAAADLFRKACDGGWVPACYHLGHCYAAYPYCGLPVDVAKAASLYKQACDGGYLHGCAYYGLTYAAPLCSPAHLDREVFGAYVARACKGGDQLGCAHLYASSLRWASAPEHDVAVELEAKACAAGVDHACLLLARCHDTTSGEDCGLPKDDMRATAYYEKACRGGDAGSCVRLIRCYEMPACALTVPSGEQQRFIALHRRTCESKGGVLGPDDRCQSAQAPGTSVDAGRRAPSP